MTTQQQELRTDLTHQHMNKRFHRTRWLIVSIAPFLVAMGTSIWILANRSTFIAILPLIIFAVLGSLIPLFQWLFPLPSPSGESTPPNQVAYRRIVGFPPLTDPRAIQQREQVVKAVYTKLTQPDTTALVLTGIGGVGKSTLAALVYRYAEEQRATRPGPFLAKTLWLTVDSTVTFVDLVGTILELLGKPIPPLGNLAPHSQAVTLFHALNAPGKPRLIIFDQFENLLDLETGYALADRPGVGEWLDIINSQPWRCRFLLTSRPRPLGTHESPSTYLQEYSLEGLDIAEGVALLQNRGVNGTEEELQIAVRSCKGHALSLSLLASLVHEHRLSLTTLLKDQTLWRGDIARRLLNYLYKQLNHIQHALLVAFSVYREPVSLEAVEAIIRDAPRSQLSDAVHSLRVQRLIEPTGDGHYQPHAIIAEYARGHVDESSEPANKEALKERHMQVAGYYQRKAEASCPPLEKRRNVSDIHDLVEAVWHLCQAEQWQEAYKLIEREEIFQSLRQWGGNTILLELCFLLQPQGNWSPPPLQAGAIYHSMAWADNALGKREDARKHYETALQLYTESEDLKGQGSILDALGWSYKAIGQLNQAEVCYKQALAIFQEREDRLAEGHGLNGLGQVYNEQGRRRQARECFEQALAICKEAGDSGVKWQRIEGRTLSNLGYIHTNFGHYSEALEYLEQSLVMRKNAGDRRGVGVAREYLGRVYRERGREYRMQERMYKEQGQDEKAAQEFKKAMQGFERAVEYFEEALSIYRTVGDRGLEGWALHNLGQVYNAYNESDQYKQAKDLLAQALLIRREVGDRRGESRTIRELGKSSSGLGQNKQALEYYKQALTISEEIPDPYGKGTIIHNAALVYIDQERYKAALACLLLARRIFDELQSPYSKETQERMNALPKRVGKEQFTALFTEVESNAQQIVDQAFLAPGIS